jgi:redox-sensitive bicupin YhaK (pirin superfamily)
MITLRRATDRHHERRRMREVWLTFDPEDRADPLADGFGPLESLNEDRLAPGAGVPRHDHHGSEIVTYVREGSLAYEDSEGGSDLVRAGEFQRMSAGRHLHHSETNASRTDWAHVFQIWLRTTVAGAAPSHEQKRFSAAERRGALCAVASPDGRSRSLRIHQDAVVYSALLEPGQHVVHELADGRSAWIHMVHGEMVLGDAVLNTGDGAGFTAERSVSFTAREKSELLLLDLGAA